MRTFAAIYLSVDGDKDFQQLHFREQHMYWTLLRQRKLNRAGLLDLNIYKWAKSAGGMSEETVVQSLAILAERKYIVIDEQTRELLIRTYVRGDGAYKMPRVMASVVSAAHEIESPRLRRALLAEIDRIPLDELSDEPGKNDAPSIRSRVLGYVLQLRKILEDGSPDDPGGLDSPADTPTVAQLRAIAGVSDTQSDTPGDTQSHGFGTRVCARMAPSPSPSPVPAPEPETLAPLASVTVLPVSAELAPEDAAAPQGQDGTLFAVPPTTAAAKPKGTKKPKKQRTPEEQDRFEKADALTREWYEALPIKPMGEEQKVFLAVRPIIEGLLKAGHEAEAIAEAARRCSRAITAKAMEYQLVALDREAARVVVPMQRSAPQPYQNPTTDAGYTGGWRRPSA